MTGLMCCALRLGVEPDSLLGDLLYIVLVRGAPVLISYRALLNRAISSSVSQCAQ